LGLSVYGKGGQESESKCFYFIHRHGV